MRKFQDFSAIQILREINFWKCRSSKNDHFAIFEDLNFDFDDFSINFLGLKFAQQNQNLEPVKSQKWQFLNYRTLQNSSKIKVAEKLPNSHTVCKGLSRFGPLYDKKRKY